MSGLSLNFVEYEMTRNTIPIHYLPYNNYPTRESYYELRDRNPNLSFYRYNDKIYYWPLKPNFVNSLSGKSISVSVTEHPKIISKIAEQALIEFMFSINSYKIRKNSHSHLWELISEKDALDGTINGLSIHRKMNISPYFFSPSNKIRYGFTFSNNLKYRFTWNISHFKSRGIDESNLRIAENGETVIPDYKTLYNFLKATGQESTFEYQVSKLESTSETFNIISKTIQWLNRNRNSIFLPSDIKFKSFDLKYLPFDKIHPEAFFAPKRYFYGGLTNTKGLKYYNQMVKEYKPSSYGQFEEKDINISFVFPAEYEGLTEVFIRKLEEVFKNELHLKNLTFHPVKINGINLSEYENGIFQDENRLKKSDLFIIVVNKEIENLQPAFSPYYYCKAKLIGDGIPSQDIQIETIKQRIHPLALSNIALNIYAKIGGTAWTIEKEEKRKDELVIGIGSTTNKDGKSILGVAQIFHSDGRYIVGDCAPLSTIENYSRVLEDYLYNTLINVVEFQINTDSPFRLIFHLYKSAGKDNEIKAIENVAKRLSNYNFDFALIHIGYGHNFRIYNNDGKSEVRKGTYIKLDSRHGLIHFVSKSNLPLKIELDKRSIGFKDLFYLAKQVYWFSNLSHKSYNPSKKTVTIMYPSLMSAMTEKLSEVPHWNYDRLKFVSDKIWFI
jgi:hypothetical protein